MLRAREWVQSNLLKRIKEGTSKEMVGEDLGSRFPFITPTNQTLSFGAKRPGDAKHESVSQLRMRFKELPSGSCIGASRMREKARDLSIPTEARGPKTQSKAEYGSWRSEGTNLSKGSLHGPKGKGRLICSWRSLIGMNACI